jgi:HEPN domain-containing protein
MNGPKSLSAWLRKADADLSAAKTLSRQSDIAWDIVCFHAQQAAEKLLKACLIANGEIPPKTHDLTLLRGLLEGGADTQSIADDCEYLIPFAIASRYPGEGVDPSKAEGDSAIGAAQRVRDWAYGFLSTGGFV